jgi:general stress protein 26
VAGSHPTVKLDARFSEPGAVVTPWEDAQRVIAEAELFWISTVRSDGRPHVTPLTTVWQDDVLHFCTGASEQKHVNMAKNAHCALTTGCNRWKDGIDIVVEGIAERITDEAGLQRLADAWETKYQGDWHFDVANNAFHGDGGEALVYAVIPTKVIAFAKGDFGQTRYQF